MAEADPTATAHRTLDGSLANFPHNFENLPERYADIFRKHGARPAYIVRDKRFTPIMYREKKDQDFTKYATDWERRHSKLCLGDGSGMVVPVVDQSMVVIGHYGVFDANQIFVPANIGYVEEWTTDIANKPVIPGARIEQKITRRASLRELIEADIEVIADRDYKRFSANSNYKTYFNPQTYFTVITDVEGNIVLTISSRNRDGVQSVWMSPLDLVSIGKLIFLAASAVVGRLIVRTLIRRRAARLVGGGSARELSGEAANIASERLVGPVTLAQMEQHLAQVVGKNPELQRLMRAAGATDAVRHREALTALEEWQRRTGRPVKWVDDGVVQETTKSADNFMSHQGGELWIEKQMTDLTSGMKTWTGTRNGKPVFKEMTRDELREQAGKSKSLIFYQETTHELSAFALAGRGGTFGPSDLAHVIGTRHGDSYTKFTNAFWLLEQAILQGDLKAVANFFR